MAGHQNMEQQQHDYQAQHAQKLAAFIRSHHLEVLEVTPHAITVNTVYCKDGKSFLVRETVAADLGAVRDYLGY